MEVEENPDPPKKNNVPSENLKFGEWTDTGKAYGFKKEIVVTI